MKPRRRDHRRPSMVTPLLAVWDPAARELAVATAADVTAVVARLPAG